MFDHVKYWIHAFWGSWLSVEVVHLALPAFKEIPWHVGLGSMVREKGNCAWTDVELQLLFVKRGFLVAL